VTRAVLPDQRLRLAFFGTPELAETILRGLLDAGEDEVALVVCQPDRPKGRGQKTEPPPVKALALARSIPVIQPEKMKDGAVAGKLREDKIDLGVVAAYGRILPQDLLDAPRFGCWNVHASILPRHRGASPIQHAILSGDRETGVSLMSMTAGLDEGPVLGAIARTPIGDTETAGELADRIAALGAQTLVDGIRAAKHGGLEATPQDPSGATYAGKIKKEDGLLHFDRPARDLELQVRGLSPWPSAYAPWIDGQPMKILRARAVPMAPKAPGEILEAGPRLVLGTTDGGIEILELQPPGKRPMAAGDYLRGAGRGLKAGGSVSG
jgi:methionyl-tRNA formyltransferase